MVDSVRPLICAETSPVRLPVGTTFPSAMHTSGDVPTTKPVSETSAPLYVIIWAFTCADVEVVFVTLVIFTKGQI